MTTFRMPLAAGIDADTGKPLPGIDEDDIAALRAPAAPAPGAGRRGGARAVILPTVRETDPNDLKQTGWGVLFGAKVPAKVKQALQPLLDHRKGQTDPEFFKVFDGPTGVRPKETARQWVERMGASLQIVDPTLGIPYYLLIVASPEDIPFDFQYVLDSHWAIGRLHFDAEDDYGRYAASVIASNATTKRRSKQVALFATAHEADAASQSFKTFVADPLVNGVGAIPPLGKPQGFECLAFVEDAATKQQLTDIYAGTIGRGAPALLFSGTHGVAFHPDDKKLPAFQGALLCQDWEGGKPGENDWFSAADVPAAADVAGLIHVQFACYGTGCPEFDTFKRGAGQVRVAPHAMIARLPQALLAHPKGGALAVIGHVDRAWAHSFVTDGRGPQIQGFRDLLGKLMTGARAGQALDQFNQRWTALAADLAESLAAPPEEAPSPEEIATRWVARDDARNYILFGDPAVRLTV